jgi:hypothetical protein
MKTREVSASEPSSVLRSLLVSPARSPAGQIYNGRVVHDDSDDMTEEEELAVAILISAEEEKRAFSGFEDALALSVAPPPPPGPSPPQPLWTSPRPCRDARMEP